VKPGTPYALLIRLGPKQPEHMALGALIEKMACSPLGHVTLGQGMVLLFRSNMSVGQIAGELNGSRIFHAEDSYLLLEIGENYVPFRQDHAKAWLGQNLD
jgi:hypothetical protein